MKRVLWLAVCILLVFALSGFAAFADKGATAKAEITVLDVSGNPGDTVYVPVSADCKNGISNAAFWIKYNKSALKYQNAYPGIISDYTVYDRSSDGRIGIALVAGDGDNNKEYGNLICFEFKIKEKAELKSYDLKLDVTFFLDGGEKSATPAVTNGKLNVEKPCAGEHQFFDWKPSVSSKCKSDGINSRYCTVCGHSENKTIEASGHSLEKSFTIDKVAENGKSGMLSRHCTVCGAKTDIVVYSEKNTAGLSINDVVDKLDDTSISNFVYFLNGGKIYPDVYGDEFDPSEYEKSTQSLRDEDGRINIAVFTDKVMRRLFGSDKKHGLTGALKRAAMVEEIPFKPICRLIQLIIL